LKYITEFRRPELGERLVSQIKLRSKKRARFMEFCGGHTVTIFRYGIRQLLPPTIEMVSGPGCPICVTANADLDRAIALAKVPGVIIATFGDMLKVPGSYSSLEKAKAEGAEVHTVYSAMDALDIAQANPKKSVVFLGIGFETTAPTIAASILQAEERGLGNYYVLSLHKVCPPVIKALLDSGEVELQGLVCPGHVSAVIGSHPWDFIASEYNIPCVISGFEPLDILQCVEMLVEQVEAGQARVEIAYKRGVKPEGNQVALKLMEEVFEPSPARWRGMGEIAGSGLKLKEEYKRFDAEIAFDIQTAPAVEHKGCICGEVLRGVRTPADCKLFAKACTPENPVGPCMVSAEGSCSAYYLYGGGRG
jgi:hydrogenase expression/formation protein HypD